MFQVFEPRGSGTWPRFDSKRAFAKLSSTLDRDEKRFEPSRILYLYLVLKKSHNDIRSKNRFILSRWYYPSNDSINLSFLRLMWFQLTPWCGIFFPHERRLSIVFQAMIILSITFQILPITSQSLTIKKNSEKKKFSKNNSEDRRTSLSELNHGSSLI